MFFSHCKIINHSYTVTFNSSRSTRTKDDVSDGIHSEVFEFDDVNYKELRYCRTEFNWNNAVIAFINRFS